MILLHVVAAALYAIAAWSLWPRTTAATPTPPLARAPHWSQLAALVVPVALVLHGWLAARDVATPQGLDLSLGNALSIVAGLTAVVAWASGLMRTLPMIGVVVLPVAAAFTLFPLLLVNPHRFSYADAPYAPVHVAVALISYALFLVAALQALVLMGLEKRLHRGLADPAGAETPPLLTLERFLFRFVGLGLLLLSLTILSGALFSEEIFGQPFRFNHKTVFSVLSWLVFAALLVGRRRYGWRGRVALRWILAGTALLFLAYLGSKFVIEVLLHR